MVEDLIRYNKKIRLDSKKRFTVDERIHKLYYDNPAYIEEISLWGFPALEYIVKMDIKDYKKMSIQERAEEYSRFETSLIKQNDIYRFPIPKEMYESINLPTKLRILGGATSFFVMNEKYYKKHIGLKKK